MKIYKQVLGDKTTANSFEVLLIDNNIKFVISQRFCIFIICLTTLTIITSQKFDILSINMNVSDLINVEFFDPHFHVWNTRDKGDGPLSASGHDASILSIPDDGPDSNGNSTKGYYPLKNYVKDVTTGLVKVNEQSDIKFFLSGGVIVEGASVCFPDEPSSSDVFQRCMKTEAKYMMEQAVAEESREFHVAPSVAFEDAGVDEYFATFLSHLEGKDGKHKVVSMRQIWNFKPSHPRCKTNLLEDEKCIEGFKNIIATMNLSSREDPALKALDVQLNYHQFAKLEQLLCNIDGNRISIVINHIGTPSAESFFPIKKENEAMYWEGMEKFAKHANVFIKISMMQLLNEDWDKVMYGEIESEGPKVHDWAKRLIDLFTPDRCMFASNFPVEKASNWSIERLFTATKYFCLNILKLDPKTPEGLEKIQKLYALSARRAYLGSPQI